MNHQTLRNAGLTGISGLALALVACGGSSSSSTPTAPANQAPTTPIISGGPLSGVTGHAYTYSLQATDPEGQTVSYELGAPVTGATISGNVLTFLPSTAGNVTITVKAKDAAGATSAVAGSVTVAVTTNANPTLPQATIALPFNGNGQVALVAKDADNDNVSYTVKAGGTFTGTATIDGTTLKLDAAGGKTSGTVILEATQSGNGIPAASPIKTELTLQVNVAAQVIHAPVFSQATAYVSVLETKTLAYNPVATDPQALPLTYSLKVPAAGVSINTATGAVSIAPALDAANFSFVIVANNGTKTAEQTVNVTVNKITAPVFSLGPTVTSYSARELATTKIFSVAVDQQNMPIQYTVGSVVGGTVTANPTTGELSIKPNLAATQVTFTVTATNGARSSQQAWTVAVTPDAAPVYTGATSLAVNAGRTKTLTLSATDADDASSAITFALKTAVAGVSISGTTLTAAPAASAATGALTATVVMTDALGKTSEQAITINVTANVAPTVSHAGNVYVKPAAGGQNQPASVVVSAVDPDAVAGDAAVTITLKSGKQSWMNWDEATKTLSGVYQAGITAGNYPVVFTATDLFGKATDYTVTVVVVDSATPVFATGATHAIPVLSGRTVTYTPAATVEDGIQDIYPLDNPLPAGVTWNNTTKTFTITPDFATYAINGGTLTFQVKAVSMLNKDATQTVTVNIAADSAPVFGAFTAQTVRAGHSFSYTVSATDANAGDTVVYSIDAASLAKGYVINANTGVITRNVLSTAPSATDTIQVTAQSKFGLLNGKSTTQNLTVNIVADQAPVWTLPVVEQLLPGQQKIVNLTANDPDSGDTYKWTLVGGTYTSAHGSTATVTEAGVLTITVSATQGNNALAIPIVATSYVNGVAGAVAPTQTLAVQVGNTVPKINSGNPTAAVEGHTVSYTFSANDPDAGDTKTWTIAPAALAGMTFANGVFTWTPGTAQVGTAQAFTVTVKDSKNAEDTRTFTITPALDQAPNFVGNFQNELLGNQTAGTGRYNEPRYIGTLVANDGEGDMIKYLLSATVTGGATGAGKFYQSTSTTVAPALTAANELTAIPATVPNPITEASYTSIATAPVAPNTKLHIWWVAPQDPATTVNVKVSAIDQVGKHDPNGYLVGAVSSAVNHAPTLNAVSTIGSWSNAAGVITTNGNTVNVGSGKQTAGLVFTSSILEGAALDTRLTWTGGVNGTGAITDQNGVNDFALQSKIDLKAPTAAWPTWMPNTIPAIPFATAQSVVFGASNQTIPHSAAWGSPYTFDLTVVDKWDSLTSPVNASTGVITLNVNAVFNAKKNNQIFLDGETGAPNVTVGANSWYIAPVAGGTAYTYDTDAVTAGVQYFIGNNAGAANTGVFTWGITPNGIPVAATYKYLVSNGNPEAANTSTYWFGGIPSAYYANGTSLELDLSTKTQTRTVASDALANNTDAGAGTALRFGLTGINGAWNAKNDTLAVFVPNAHSAKYYGTVGTDNAVVANRTLGAENTDAQVTNFMVNNVITGSNVTLDWATKKLWFANGTSSDIDGTVTTDRDNAYFVRHTAAAAGAYSFTTAQQSVAIANQALTDTVINNLAGGIDNTGVYQLADINGRATVSLNASRNDFAQLASSVHGVQSQVVFNNDTFNVYAVLNGTTGPVVGSNGAYSLFRQLSNSVGANATDAVHATLAAGVNVSAAPANFATVAEYIYNFTATYTDVSSAAGAQALALPGKMGSYVLGTSFTGGPAIRPVLNPRFVRGTVNAAAAAANPFIGADMTNATTGGGAMTISWVNDPSDAANNGADQYSGVKIEFIHAGALDADPAAPIDYTNVNNKTFYVAPGITSLTLKAEIADGFATGNYMVRITKVKTGEGASLINFGKTPFAMTYPYHFAEAVGLVKFD